MRSSFVPVMISWSVVGLFLTCLSALIHAEADPHRLIGRNIKPREVPVPNANVRRQNESTVTDINVDLSWRDTIYFSATHQNPAMAPPAPMPGLDNYTTASTLGISPRGMDFASLQRRDGALHCDNGPCVDGSCCSKDGICGYGPDFCGSGCRSQCDATAMCGEFSKDADVPCGMNLCCSATGWCGTTEVYCKNADPIHNTLPCQAGYGGCSMYPAPKCDPRKHSSSGRTVGYYQSWNVRQRQCNTKTPKQLDTTGYTHLFYSFAFIDPVTFHITAAHADDEAMMKEFTSLAKTGLQTWIAIGGFDFSDPGPTHTTWSDMVSTKANRAAFISSVETYMKTYGFHGVDLDWEYPGEPKRGGREMTDTRNFATLVREMRAAWGQNYGISVTLAPDYWYLRWFDAKAMESSVDFFGFMAYDLHGSWDTDVLTLGSKVRGQADIRDISNNTTPLWFDGLDPAKINFGLALYGRGYTLSDPSCNGLLCPFAGPSKPGPCVAEPGVMSLSEIKQVIKNRDLKSEFLHDSMMKQITWDDQWIGYDDEETWANKKRFANSMCFGGTMIWSIDFQEEATMSDTEPGDGQTPGPIIDLPNKGTGGNGGPDSGTGGDQPLHGTPFAGFTGCTTRQIKNIVETWNDIEELVRIPATLNLDRGTSDWCQGICSPQTVETRIWGRTIGYKSRVKDALKIREVFSNIAYMGTSDHITGHIRISCVDEFIPSVPFGDRPRCADKTDGRSTGAYALSTSTNYRDNTIVVCDAFLNTDSLAERGSILNNSPEKRHDPVWMFSRAAVMLHELTHLSAICGDYPTSVIDQKVYWSDADGGARQKIYGIKKVEKLARIFPELTTKNADNYAWYATEKYFEAIYGTPDAQLIGRDEDIINEPDDDNTPPPVDPAPPATPTKALNIILQDRMYNSQSNWITDEMTWRFYSVPYGTASECKDNPVTTAAADKSILSHKNPPFPAGTFDVKTQDGDCQYKNDGNGNPGALWCGGTGHSCKAHENKDKAGREVICKNLPMKSEDRTIFHRAVVACEW